MTTLSQIAADVRRLAPERLSATAVTCCKDALGHTRDELARGAVGWAMVLACPRGVQRATHGTGPIWFAWDKDGRSMFFDDRDHGNDPLLSLHAAFCWAMGGGA